ncbi:PREDICTED: von Willebrand factor A domain-containing protein 5A-like [Poecilia mexicana]|uniref:von Willebrand factor A domain-containing protein 5A-like n=1 Tax=Poecilia mexicana TaxID=48701 RepID=UPI00072E2434|nr:PREDICTED: von Willebrand factor A domain-containing protein 5A-like [Poecilia mexicana]
MPDSLSMDSFQDYCGALPETAIAWNPSNDSSDKDLGDLNTEDMLDSSIMDFVCDDDSADESADETEFLQVFPDSYGLQEDSDEESSEPEVVLLSQDPLLQLVSLQKASGCWKLNANLATVLGKTKEEVEKAKPQSVCDEVWASILALIWLHGFKMDAKEEWELLSMKAASWIKAQNAPSVSECAEAGNTLLGCSVKKEALGL